MFLGEWPNPSICSGEIQIWLDLRGRRKMFLGKKGLS